MTSYRKSDTVYTYLAVPNAQVLEVDARRGQPRSTGSEAGSIAAGGDRAAGLLIANALANSSGDRAPTTSGWPWSARTGATYKPITVPKLPASPHHGVPTK